PVPPVWVRADWRVHGFGRLCCGLLPSLPRCCCLALDGSLSLCAPADAGRGARDAAFGRDRTEKLGQAGGASGGVRNRLVIASKPCSTSLRSIASLSARSARAIAITWALKVT